LHHASAWSLFSAVTAQLSAEVCRTPSHSARRRGGSFCPMVSALCWIQARKDPPPALMATTAIPGNLFPPLYRIDEHWVRRWWRARYFTNNQRSSPGPPPFILWMPALDTTGLSREGECCGSCLGSLSQRRGRLKQRLISLAVSQGYVTFCTDTRPSTPRLRDGVTQARC